MLKMYLFLFIISVFDLQLGSTIKCYDCAAPSFGTKTVAGKTIQLAWPDVKAAYGFRADPVKMNDVECLSQPTVNNNADCTGYCFTLFVNGL